MASKKPGLLANVQRIAAGKPAPPVSGEQQPSISYPLSTRAEESELPEQAAMLSDRLQTIARQYLGARRRSGEALLEAARWLSEARAEAQHGEWQQFLEATGTSDDAAERLLHIHSQAMQNPQFADSVRRNWISQSVAALLARPSTPPEVVGEFLESSTQPSVAEVQQKLRTTRRATASRNVEAAQNPQIADFGREAAAQNPQIADFEGGPAQVQNPQFADFEGELAQVQNPQFADFGRETAEFLVAEHPVQMLQRAAALLAAVASASATISDRAAAEQSMKEIEWATATIREALARGKNDAA